VANRHQKRLLNNGGRNMANGGIQSTKGSGGRNTTSSFRRKSRNSVKQSKGSKRHWRPPRNVREFAAQANQVATMVLNSEIDEDKARTYASIARVVSQSASVEVTRARFLKTAPDLSLEEED
jgi:hypothetical protein